MSPINGGAYFGFTAAVFLTLEMLPMLLISVFFGVFFGSVMNEKSAPGITSVLIAAAGVLGGARMPLDTMGGFEAFCLFIRPYISVAL